jgi:hypothetical protein
MFVIAGFDLLLGFFLCGETWLWLRSHLDTKNAVKSMGNTGGYDNLPSAQA